MAPVSVGFGIVLAVLGVLFYFPEQKSITALIPAFFGLGFILLGLLAYKENLRKHVMHLAAALGLIGFLVPTIRVLPGLARYFSGEDTSKAHVVIEQALMAVVCLVFTGLCVNSFIEARRARKAGNVG